MNNLPGDLREEIAKHLTVANTERLRATAKGMRNTATSKQADAWKRIQETVDASEKLKAKIEKTAASLKKDMTRATKDASVVRAVQPMKRFLALSNRELIIVVHLFLLMGRDARFVADYAKLSDRFMIEDFIRLMRYSSDASELFLAVSAVAAQDRAAMEAAALVSNKVFEGLRDRHGLWVKLVQKRKRVLRSYLSAVDLFGITKLSVTVRKELLRKPAVLRTADSLQTNVLRSEAFVDPAALQRVNDARVRYHGLAKKVQETWVDELKEYASLKGKDVASFIFLLVGPRIKDVVDYDEISREFLLKEFLAADAEVIAAASAIALSPLASREVRKTTKYDALLSIHKRQMDLVAEVDRVVGEYFDAIDRIGDMQLSVQTRERYFAHFDPEYVLQYASTDLPAI
jgi:hypothetical protein